MRQKFGDITLQDLAFRVAAKNGCTLASGPDRICTVVAHEVAVELWASLDDAWGGGWGALLWCQRHMSSLKATKPCPEPVELNILTLVSLLGGEFKLDRLPAKFKCPRCKTELVAIEWHVPKEPPSAGGAAARSENILRLRPGRIHLAKERFRKIEGGKA